MAETVKTIENVDRLFSQIIVNGEVHESSNYVPPVEPQQTIPVVTEPQEQPVQNENQGEQQSTQGEDVYAVELNDVLHNFVDQAVTQGLAEEVTARETADTSLDERLDAVEEVIPSSASSSNKLADQASIGTIAEDVATQTVNGIIADLDVSEKGGNGKYIKAISESNGKISATEGTIDSSVSSGSENPVTGGAVNTAITNAVNALDVAQSGGDGKYIKAISEVDGKISTTEGTIDSSVTSGSGNPVSSDAVNTAIGAIETNVGDIEELIPEQASAENQLADKNFVNSSIASNTSNFIGTFESVTELRAYTGTVTNNDYAFVRNTVVQYNGGDFPNVTALNNYDKTLLTNGDYAWVVNSEDNTKFDLYRFDIIEQTWLLRATKIDKSLDILNAVFNRYKATVSGSTVTWAYEYTLNNSSFTAEQWATINSGLTSTSISDAINALDVSEKGGNGKYIKAISEADGKISATEGTIDSSVNSGSSNPVTGGAVYTGLDGKVDKVAGKGLSTNDFTDTLKNKLDNIQAGAQVNSVTGVKGNSESSYRTGNVNITKSNIGLGNVVNTGDSDTPVSGGTTKFTTGGAYNLLLNLASAFDTATAYAIGDYVTYNGNLYRCTTAHSAGAWDSTHFTVVNVGDEIEQLNEIMASLPTDAVLHYSFDEVPDYPDGTADYRPDFNTSNGGWVTDNYGVLSHSNGVLNWKHGTNTSEWRSVQNMSTAISGKIATLEVKPNFTVTNDLYQFIFLSYDGSTYTTILGAYTVELKPNEWNKLIGVVPSDCNGVVRLQSLVSYADSASFDIRNFYIGDGSYSTPIIDNTNGQNNGESHGEIAKQGISGKGVYFPSANQYVSVPTSKFPAPTSNTNISISVWLKIPTSYTVDYSSDSTNCLKPIVSVGSFAGLFGIVRNNRFIQFSARDSVSSKSVYTAFPKGEWFNFIASYDGTTHKAKVYLNGNLIGETEASIADYQFGSNLNNWYIWSNLNVGGLATASTNQPATLDDLLIFNRALSEQEVQALYLNKANTPKYYDINNYVIDNADATPTADSKNLVLSGGVASALSGKQDTLTFDDVPTENSNNPVKSYGIYNCTYNRKNLNYTNASTTTYIKFPALFSIQPHATNSYMITAKDGSSIILSCGTSYSGGLTYIPPVAVYMAKANVTDLSLYYNSSDHTIVLALAPYSDVSIIQLCGRTRRTLSSEVISDITGYTRITINELQGKLTFDSTPTQDSTNPVTSGGVYNALLNKQPKTLATPITIEGTQQTTVEGALGALAQASSSVETGRVISTMGDVPDGFLNCGKSMIEKFVQNTNFPAHYEAVSLLQASDGTIYVGTGSSGIYKSTNGITFTQITSSAGGHTTHALLQTSDGTIYAGLAEIGIYKSIDGTTFSQVSGFPTSYSVRAFLQTSDGTIYVGTMSHGIYKSTNGTTFSQVSGFPTSYSAISLLQTLDGTIYVGTVSHGIYKSTNGTTFSQVSGFPTSYSAISLLQASDGTIYVGTGTGVYKSADGTTFSQVSGFSDEVDSLLQSSDGAIYAGTGYYGLFKTTDGITLSQVSVFPDNRDSVYSLLQDINGTLYVGTGSYGICKSIPFRELDKTTYADLYAVVGDRYNAKAGVTSNTLFAIPLVGNDDLTYAVKT